MSDRPTAGRAGARWYWLVPALTFLVGLVLGGAVFAVTDRREGDAAPSTAPLTATSAPTPDPTVSGRTITIPASCEQGLERARAALSTAGEAAEALRQLKTARLQELLDQLQDAEREVTELVDRCRRQAPALN